MEYPLSAPFHGINASLQGLVGFALASQIRMTDTIGHGARIDI
jgi:hypothetical protein